MNNNKSIKKIEKYSNMIKEKAENVSLLALIAGFSIASSVAFTCKALISFRDNGSISEKIIYSSLALVAGSIGALLIKSKNNELNSLKKKTDYLEERAKSNKHMSLVIKNNQNKD